MTADPYQQMCEDVAFAELPPRTIVEVAGDDRAKFLHNLSTNDVKKLHEAGSGHGCEAYFTTVQGKILLHACMYFHDDSIVIDASPGHADAILPHLDKYLITEDVTLTNRSGDWRQIWIAGPNATRVLGELGFALPAESLSHVTVGEVTARRVPFAPVDCFVLQIASALRDDWSAKLKTAGVTCVDEATVETARIEAGFPSYGHDITVDNLPQEVNRDKQAISFTKGCYLGQETVARIDALGHVNRHFVRLEFEESAEVAVGNDIVSNEDGAEKVVGKVTSIAPISAAMRSSSSSPIGLGYVRRAAIEANVSLRCGGSVVTIRG